MILHKFLILFFVSNGFAKSVSTEDSCNESRTSFFVTDNASLKSENFIVYKDTSEEDCLKTCSHNMDQFKRPISCESFTYDHASFSCTIFKDKAVPAGSGKIETVLGKRYFEKICLKQDIPSTCGQSQFMRVDQSVLVGYAFNMTLTDSIESCVTQCIQENDCKSAMYFYQDGECITNKESALTKPTGFTKEEDDRVVYFQNGCNGEAALPPKMTNGDQPSDVSIEPESIPDEDDTKPEVNIQISETTPKPVNNNDKSLEGETSDEKNEQFSEEYEESTGESAEIESTTNKFTSIETTETTPQKSELELSKDESRNKEKTLIQKKITKHPRNFGSKTYEILKKQETSKQVKNVANEIENPIEAETMQEKEATYFSEWSDWTPCTKSQERQVRRRRCLNLRKCLGALMQVQSCPDLVPTSTPQNNLSIRSIVSVDGEEYDDPITVDNISVESVPSRLLPLLNEQVWGPWQGSCQQFASSQPCNAGSMIGFESRECIAKNPTQCEGPFFRYCTLNC